MRLFVAINLSENIKNALLKAQNDLKNQGFYGNFTRRENMHLTLAFIGETEKRFKAVDALKKISFERFELSLGTYGNFRDLWWVGIEKNKTLEKLACETAESLRSAGFEIERRAFKPHITLVRELKGSGKPKILLPECKMTCEKISLMSSERSAGKLIYREIFFKTCE